MAAQTHTFLQGGGEMGRLTRTYDWSQTPVGTPDTWPQSLRTTVSIILSSRFPMFLWWGPEMIQFYNDAYRPSLGNEGKHPLALGQSGPQCWPEIWEVIYPLIDQVISTGEATWSEDQLIPIFRNGKIEDVYWTFGYSPVRGESGEVQGVLVVCNETTEKVQSIQKLRASEQRFQNLIHEATIGIVVLSGEQMIIDIINDAYIQLSGRSYEHLIGRPLFEAIPEAAPYFKSIIEKVRTTGTSITLNNHPYFIYVNGVRQEGFLDIVYQHYLEPDGITSSVMVLCQDVTDQVLARQQIEHIVAIRTKELAETNNKLQKSNEELAQFAYIASHDLQEPLRKVSTFAQMLELSLAAPDDKSRNYLNKINNAVSRMSTLIRDVLSYSRLSKDNELFSPVDLQEIMNSIVSDFELLIEQKQARIRYTALPVIEAIPLQMHQLFSNLLSNALKYSHQDTPPDIHIGVEELTATATGNYPLLHPQNTYYKITVADNGIGFQQEYADQIFNIFQRLHGQSEYSGTGIGLAMCKKIILNHQGYISVTARSGQGASFEVLLPAKQLVV